MANHSSILAWRISMDRGAWWAIVHGVTESDTAAQLSTAQYIHIMEYYSALKKKALLTYSITWTNFEDIVTEISQTPKTNTVWFHLNRVHGTIKLIESKSSRVAIWGWGEMRMGSYCSMDIDFQPGKTKNVLEMDTGDSCPTMWIYSMPLNCTLTNGQTVKFTCILPQRILKTRKQLHLYSS